MPDANGRGPALMNSKVLLCNSGDVFQTFNTSRVQLAVRETDLDEETFPPTFEQTDWTWEQVLNEEYFPD